ncbi:MAG: hypothetical protein ACRDZQ_08490 [Acidimicrobiales bacterium]
MTLAMAANASRRQVLLLDVLLSLWVAAWVAIGILVGIDVHHLGQLSTTLGNAGRALRQTGNGLKAFSTIPFVGHAIGGIAKQIVRTGHVAEVNAAQSRQSIDQLSYLLAVCVAIIPGVPVLGIYLPFRIGRIREARAVRQALAHAEHPPLLQRYLANRALYNLPYHQLEQISHEPWQDVERGDLTELAEAELARLGFGRRERARLRSRLP